MKLLSRLEGIIPALETSHAIYQATLVAREMAKDQILVVNLSGRGDKDMVQVSQLMGVEE
jgi:tryptophan synthase beta chain